MAVLLLRVFLLAAVNIFNIMITITCTTANSLAFAMKQADTMPNYFSSESQIHSWKEVINRDQSAFSDSSQEDRSSSFSCWNHLPLLRNCIQGSSSHRNADCKPLGGPFRQRKEVLSFNARFLKISHEGILFLRRICISCRGSRPFRLRSKVGMARRGESFTCSIDACFLIAK